MHSAMFNLPEAGVEGVGGFDPDKKPIQNVSKHGRTHL